jgi:hypothetical protein
MNISEFIERLKRSTLGQRILSEADRDEQIDRERAELIAEYATLQAEADVTFPDLAAAEKRILDAAIAAIRQSHVDAMAAQARKQAAENRINGRMGRIEQRLRQIADPRTARRGPIPDALEEARLHVSAHRVYSTLAIEEQISDCRETGNKGTQKVLEDKLALAVAAGPIEQAIGSAAVRYQRLWAVPVDKLEGELRAIAAAIPKKCPCGADFGAPPARREVPVGVAS